MSRTQSRNPRNTGNRPTQHCPICRVRQPLEAAHCNQCGATLAGAPNDTDRHDQVQQVLSAGARVPPTMRRRPPELDVPPPAQWDVGETDLYSGGVPTAPLPSVAFGLALVALLVLGSYLIWRLASAPDAAPAAIFLNMTDQAGVGAGTSGESVIERGMTRRAPPPTNTRVMLVPTAAIPTITPEPPTATSSPVQEPCFQRAEANDTLYGLASRCGHRDLGIVDVILRLNNMSSAGQLQIGQIIEIPWPTPIGAENAIAGLPTEEGMPEDTRFEPTLPPGVMWYTVTRGETALSVVLDHNMTMRILRDLNPGMRFEGCDFGIVGGGDTCNVMVFEGQRLRVVAPTPTPTMPPTASGSETPTPTPTPTVNAPFAQLPSNNMLFGAYELPTLRWVASGQLQIEEVYLVTVEDRTAGITYSATTRELSFQLPAEWQPTDGKRHVFAWQVTIATLRDGNTAVPSPFSTETRTFTWQSR